jgi:hypothetical protein
MHQKLKKIKNSKSHTKPHAKTTKDPHVNLTN